MDVKMEQYARKTFLALKNPYHTVERVYPNVIDRVRTAQETHGYAFYTGYKQTASIPGGLPGKMEAEGFLTHTRDRMSLGGRAVDMQLVNPLTGRHMTGSSSGTALNVFYGINDLGVGTDGGGSVLAPAAALNLYGFISPLIEEEYLKQFQKVSTDGISFSPSLGVISRDWDTLKKAVQAVPELGLGKAEAGLPGPGTQTADKNTLLVQTVEADGSLDLFGPREPLIRYVREMVRRGRILISREGPVDLFGLGDTVFGHFSEETGELQRRSGKGLMRVANMCGLSALTVPDQGLGRCTLLLCESSPEDIRAMFRLAEDIRKPRSPLVERYFGNLKQYFEDGC